MARTLRTYFESAAQQRAALKELGEWFDPAELDLYDASCLANDASTSEAGRFGSFQKIYWELSSSRWNVFRPYGAAKCWPPEQVFKTIEGTFGEFSWRGPVNLLNFAMPGREAGLAAKLRRMRGIKPVKDYPLMTVSKFLHFYNPALFPIYDTEIIWNRVFAGFGSEFQAFCGYGYNYRDDCTEMFMLYYMRWAANLLSGAHNDFMRCFVEWLNEQPRTQLSGRRFDAMTLYARAFEYTATGAAFKEFGRDRPGARS